MHKLDEDILRCYCKLEEYQKQRIRMEIIWHPEKFKWSKGGPAAMTDASRIRREEMARLGFGEAYYQRMLEGEQLAKKELEGLAEIHVLWPHCERINGLGKLLTGKFIAASGDITRPGTVSSFWKGMGLDILPDGTVPRRIRTRSTKVARNIPTLPHVSKIGEEIRQSILRSKGKLRGFYDQYKAYYTAKYPERPKMFNHKAGLRISQKILYSCLWREWRLAYGLPAPDPYAFDILKHPKGHMITITDLYDK